MNPDLTLTPWVCFTKRTEDPKLAWIERRLADCGIPSRRNGHSFHAPILEVLAQDEAAAWAFLAEPIDGRLRYPRDGRGRFAPGPRTVETVDDVPDDDPLFTE